LGENLCAACQNSKDNSEIKDEIRKLKEFLEKKSNKKDDQKNGEKWSKTTINKNPLQELLNWMKKEGIVAFSFKDNKLIIELDGRRTRTLEDSNLTPEQAELKNYFQQNPTAKQSLSRSELEKEIFGAEGTNSHEKNNKNWVAPVAIGVGVIVLFVVGIIIYKMSKKNNY